MRICIVNESAKRSRVLDEHSHAKMKLKGLLIITADSDSGGQKHYLENLLISLTDCLWLVYFFLRRKIERSE